MAEKRKIELVDASGDFPALYRQRNSADFVLVSSDGKEFKVHKEVLTARSTVFDAMLTQKRFKESETGRSEIKDIDGKTLDAMLTFLYGVFSRKAFDLQKLVTAADKYDITNLLSVEAITKLLTVHNVMDALVMADKNGMTDLKKVCLTYVGQNVQKLSAGQFKKVRPESLLKKVLSTGTMKRYLASENVGDVLVLAHRYSRRTLMKTCLEFIQEHFFSFLRTGQFDVVRRHDGALTERVLRHFPETKDADGDCPVCMDKLYKFHWCKGGFQEGSDPADFGIDNYDDTDDASNTSDDGAESDSDSKNDV